MLLRREILKKKLTFEEAFSELEMLALKMENENLGLEESMKCYQKANNLYKFCEKMLKNADQKITEIE